MAAATRATARRRLRLIHTPARNPLDETALSTLQAVCEPLLPSVDVQAGIDGGSISVFDHDACDALGLGAGWRPEMRRRRRGGRRATTGWLTSTGPSDLESFRDEDRPAQNLPLRIPIADTVRTTLAAHDWPTVIESEETLAKLSQP